MYTCKHFGIKELVSDIAYAKQSERCWRFLDPIALKGIDTLREIYGSCTINDWAWGGTFRYSGLRLQDELPQSSQFSAHRFGRAFDLKFDAATPEQVRQDILNGVINVRGLTELELDTPTWVHVAFNTNVTGLLTFRP